MSRYSIPNKPVLRILLLIFALVNLQISAAFSAPLQENNRSLLKKAENRYHQGEFDQTLKLIRQFLQKDSASKPERVKAYILLSKTFIAQNKTNAAKEIVRKIFTVNPAYHPTLEQEKPSYVHLVDAVRREIKPKQAKEAVKKSKSHTLLWAGAGGATALVLLVGVLLSGNNGDGKSHTLPKPPDFPK